MYELKILSHFSAAHQLMDFEGGCERLHGHNWKIEVHVVGRNLKKNGLVIDFRVVKEATKRVLDELDHNFLNELDAFKTLNPSSENISCYVFKALSRELNSNDVTVSKVTAWESDSACASYMEP